MCGSFHIARVGLSPTSHRTALTAVSVCVAASVHVEVHGDAKARPERHRDGAGAALLRRHGAAQPPLVLVSCQQRHQLVEVAPLVSVLLFVSLKEHVKVAF